LGGGFLVHQTLSHARATDRVKWGSWESRGNRIGTTYKSAEACAGAKTALFDAQAKYHSMTLPYAPRHGPNSNSFTEQM